MTLEKKIPPPLLPGFELATFRSRVRHSNQQAIPTIYRAPIYPCYNKHAHCALATTIIKLIIFVAYCVCWLCSCCHNRPNSGMDYRIFIARTDVNACACTRGVHGDRKESALKVDCGREKKSLAAPGNRTCVSGVAARCCNQLSYNPSSSYIRGSRDGGQGGCPLTFVIILFGLSERSCPLYWSHSGPRVLQDGFIQNTVLKTSLMDRGIDSVICSTETLQEGKDILCRSSCDQKVMELNPPGGRSWISFCFCAFLDKKTTTKITKKSCTSDIPPPPPSVSPSLSACPCLPPVV